CCNIALSFALLRTPAFPTRRSSDLTVTGMWCKPAPRFEVGQKVTFTYSPKGTSFEIMAGPFPDEGESFYVLKDQDGNHDTSKERSEEHTSELQSRENLVCRLLLEKK